MVKQGGGRDLKLAQHGRESSNAWSSGPVSHSYERRMMADIKMCAASPDAGRRTDGEKQLLQ